MDQIKATALYHLHTKVLRHPYVRIKKVTAIGPSLTVYRCECGSVWVA